jgi:positive phototaxis protein PixI
MRSLPSWDKPIMVNSSAPQEAAMAAESPRDKTEATVAGALLVPATDADLADAHVLISPSPISSGPISPSSIFQGSSPNGLPSSDPLESQAIPTIAAQIKLNARAIGNPHVRLRLDNETIAAVNTDLAQEVMVIPQQRLTVMPNMPPAVMGLLNHRSRIFWVLDLPRLFGLTPLDPRLSEYHLAILRVNNKSVALAVQQVEGVARFTPEEIESPLEHELAAELVPYLQGCIPQGEDVLLVLDAAAISAYDASPSEA